MKGRSRASVYSTHTIFLNQWSYMNVGRNFLSRLAIAGCISTSMFVYADEGTSPSLKLMNSESPDTVPARPASPSMQVIAGLGSGNSISTARLFLVMPYQESAAPLTQQQLMHMGCSFETARTPPLERLVAIVHDANVTRYEGATRRELRRLLILVFKDGSEMHFELGVSFTSDAVLFGSIDGLAVTADKALGNVLIEWAQSLPEKSECTKNLEYYR